MRRQSLPLAFSLYLVITCAVGTRMAWAANPFLTVLDSTGVAGGDATLTIQLTAGTIGVSGFQVDLSLPDSLTPLSVTAGSAALAAGKIVQGNQISPGVYRVVEIGLNQNVIGPGAVAILSVQVTNGTSPGVLSIGTSNIAFTDPAGNPVTGSGTGGLFTVLTGGPISFFGVSATGVTASSATIVWTTDAAGDSQVNYGLTSAYGSSTALDSTLVTSHSQGIAGLVASTVYHFQVQSNGVTSGDFLFSTAGGAPPAISAVSPAVLGPSSATITWSTDIPATSQVEYGTTTAYGISTAFDPTFVLSHTVTVVGLSSATLYHFAVQSQDGSGDASVSPDSTFTTAAPVVFASSPVITSVTVSNITPFTADFSWTTDQPSNSFVTYGQTNVFFLIASDALLATSHVVHVSSLTPNFTYNYWVGSQNSSGWVAISTPTIFTTASATASDFPTLTIGSGSGALGSTVNIDVQFSPGLVPITSMQFDLPLPGAVTGGTPATGAAASAANMTVTGTQLAGGVYRVFVNGLGATLSQSGSIATVHLVIGSDAFSGSYALAPINAEVFDRNLNSIGPVTVAGALVITGGGGSVRVSPNPWRADRHSGNPITFANLSQNCEIRIFTTSGHWVATLNNVGSVVTWDLKNNNGNLVASGIYYYLITGPDREKTTGEFVVIR